MAVIPSYVDPTLAALDRLHAQTAGEPPRPYLGASSIGQPCERRLWYGFRWALARTLEASGYRAIQDGHRGEAVMIDWLRQIPGVQLWTEDPDPERPGQQIGFQALAGHFRGNLDGVIQGLKQAPQTPHVWECKVVNETKFNRLKKLILERGEKQALAAWDEVYFAQAQVYMHALDLTRHYLTVCTPGNRAIISCRTNYQPDMAQALVAKAERIITAARPPLKLSDDPAFWQCKWCDFHALCHGQAAPLVHCRTCAHSTAQLSDQRPWMCELHKQPLSEAKQRAGCDHHAFHPDLLANHAQPINADPQTGRITFQFPDASILVNGHGGTASLDWWRDRQGIANLAAHADAVSDSPDSPDSSDSDEAKEVLTALAAEAGYPAAQLQAGALTEADWHTVYDAAVRLFAGPWLHDAARAARLRALIEQIDAQYLALAERADQRRVAT